MAEGAGPDEGETNAEEIARLRRRAGDDARRISRLQGELREAETHQAESDAREAVAGEQAGAQSSLIARLRAEAGVRDAALTEVREALTSVALELDDLRAVRDALTPAALTQRRGLVLTAAFRPSARRVSGDFYLATAGATDSTVVVVGDVAGKGPDAARQAAFLRTAFTALAPFSDDPCQLLRWADTAFGEGAEPFERFATAICVTYDPDRHEARWARAGHPPPVKLFSGEELHDGEGRLPLGAGDERSCAHGVAVLEPGEGLLLYTDGLTEARSGGEQYGPQRVGALVRALGSSSGDALVEELQHAATDFADGTLGDDLCLVALQAAAD